MKVTSGLNTIPPIPKPEKAKLRAKPRLPTNQLLIKILTGIIVVLNEPNPTNKDKK